MPDDHKALDNKAPDYKSLVEFLLEPILEQRQALRINCETNASGTRTWLRVAFDPQDKGRVLGKSGRTIQSVRNVLAMAAKLADQTVHLEIYDPAPDQNVLDYASEATDGYSRNRTDDTRERVEAPKRHISPEPILDSIQTPASGAVDKPSKAIKLREHKDK